MPLFKKTVSHNPPLALSQIECDDLWSSRGFRLAMSEMFVNRGLVNKMRYFRGVRHGYGVPYASHSWGSFEFFIEIDDQYVSRQVNRFEYGELLRYDRQHWCDEFGMMFVRRFSRKQKAFFASAALGEVRSSEGILPSVWLVCGGRNILLPYDGLYHFAKKRTFQCHCHGAAFVCRLSTLVNS